MENKEQTNMESEIFKEQEPLFSSPPLSEPESAKDHPIIHSERKQKSYKKYPRRRNHTPLIAAFVIPMLIMIVIFIERSIFPFGEHSFLRTDMYHQYAPFFSNFYERISSAKSLTYSWDIGMGVNFTALYAYYLASPLNWLILLCPKGYVIEFMTYSIVLKIGLSGLTFAYYLQQHNRSRKFGVAFFGICYALSGYMAAYSWNIMWLDCILLFPLILLGLERLIKKKKGYLYCITLGISILSNYYISIMICIYMVIYFIAFLIMENKWNDWYKTCIRFAVYSLIAGALSAIVLLPEIYALGLTASSDFSFPKTVTSYFSILSMMGRHLPNVEVEIGLDHWPNLYSGVFVLVLLPIYIRSKGIPVREKIVKCVLLVIFYASFSTNVLNFIWHGFHFPNSLPCRQSFLYIALVLHMCFEAYQHLDTVRIREILACFWGSIAFVLILERFNTDVTEDSFHFSVFYISMLFLALYTGLLYLYRQRKLERLLLIILTTTLLCIEMAMNTSVTSITTTSRTSYMKQTAPIEEIVTYLKDDLDFYRMEKDERKTKNDGAWSGYPSISLFSSTANASLTSIFKKFGLESSTNSYSFTGATPLISSLFSVKYMISENTMPETDLMSLAYETEIMNLYRNQYTLPLGFMIDRELPTDWSLSGSTPAQTQNNLSTALGFEDILTEIPSDSSSNKLTIYPESDGYLYVYVKNKSIETVNATMGERSKKFTNVNRGYLIDLGYCYTDEEIILTAEEKSEGFEATAYAFSMDIFKQVFDTLNKNPLTLSKWSDTKLNGKISAEEDGYLFTSIPYEKGWTVYVDGIKAETVPFNDTFLMVPIRSGDHEIRLNYEPEGLSFGMAITAAGILALISIDLFTRIKKTKYKDKGDRLI